MRKLTTRRSVKLSLSLGAHRFHPAKLTGGSSPISGRTTNGWSMICLSLITSSRRKTSFKAENVRQHAFSCKFQFLEPPGTLTRLLKRYRVSLQSNNKIDYKPERKWGSYVCNIPQFSVVRGTTRLRFVCFYEYPRKAVKIIIAVATALTIVLLDKLLAYLLK